MANFTPWPKTARYHLDDPSLDVIISEKIDGTNAAIIIDEGKVVGAQSRTRLITPEDDNYQFAEWAYTTPGIAEALGDGHHFGEWAGPKIQKNPMNLEERTFFLFNIRRWGTTTFEGLPIQTPRVFYDGPYTPGCIENALTNLTDVGQSLKYEPEGVVAFFPAFNLSLKATYKGTKR